MPADTAPFYAASKITDLRYFVGYQQQLDRITNRAVGDQPTSINVIGDKRIGKSSLLCHFVQTYEQRITSRRADPSKYLAVYLSLEQGNCQHKSSFYSVVAQELRDSLVNKYSSGQQTARSIQGLIQALDADNFDTARFYEVMAQFRDVDILPILCLDKIEALFRNPNEFNDGFYDNLRSLMDDSALMLVIASDKDLKVYSRQKKLTSRFFNLGHKMILSGYTKDSEAMDLVRLPQTTIPGSQAVLNEKEQKIALEWGGRNPYLLQWAGLCLWDAQQNREGIAWARKRFVRQAKGISAKHSIWRKCWLLFKLVIWGIPVKLGQIGKFVGANLGEIGDGIIGWGVIGIILLVVFQIVPPESIIEGIKNVLGLGG